MKENIYTRSQILYLTAIILISFGKGMGLPGNNSIYIILFSLAVVLIVLKISRDIWDISILYKVMIVGIIALVNFFFTREPAFLFSLVLLVGVKGISFHSILKVAFFSRIFAFITTVGLSFLGVLPKYEIVFYRNNTFISRFGYGFEHPNLLHSSFVMIVLFGMYLYYNKINLVHYTFILLLNLLIYYASASRTGFYIIIIAVVVHLFSQLSFFKNVLRIVLPWLQIILTLITITLALNIQKPIVARLDEYFTGRLYYANLQFQYFPSLLGRHYPSELNINFDNSYSMLFALYGIIVALLLHYWYCSTAVKIRKLSDFAPVFLFFVLSIIMFTESYYTNAVYNVTLFMTAIIFFNGEKEEFL